MSYAYSDIHLNIGDVAVIMSYSGETREMYNLAEIAKEYGATVISITKYGKNSINSISDIKLLVSSNENLIRSVATGSRIAQLSLIDIIYIATVSMYYEKSMEYLERTRKVLKPKKMH